MMKRSLILTGDGSHTVTDGRTGDTFHSRFGAITESRHIYIKNGFEIACHGKTCLNILEVGFGTGLNAFLTAIESGKRQISVYYFAIEPYPLEPDIIIKLNYPALTGEFRADELFAKMHEVIFDTCQSINDFFSLEKKLLSFHDTSLPASFFNLVYFDAFGPSFQPELWSLQVFKKIYDSMENRGVLVTFSSRGQVRRDLTAAGFYVDRIPGPKGKQEVTRATKQI